MVGEKIPIEKNLQHLRGKQLRARKAVENVSPRYRTIKRSS